MYLSHFKLEEKPFSLGADPKFLWLGEKYKEALANLKNGILYSDGCLVVTGDVGTGKTTLANVLVHELRDQLTIARVAYPDVDILDFFRLILTSYGVTDTFQDKASFLAHFEPPLYAALTV